MLTLRCPARCAHCVVQSSPERTETLPPSQAARMVDEAGKAGLPVVFSGGEPLLQLSLLLDLTRRARRLGVPVAVSTSGYWGHTPEGARRMVARLAEAGVGTLLMSTDIYHAPFVKIETVMNAALAAVSHGLHCEIAVPTPEGDDVSMGLARRLRELPGVLVKIHPVAKTGRAAGLEPATFRAGLHSRPCATLGQMMLMPDGYLYACCAASANHGRDGVLCAGNCETVGLQQAVAFWQSIPLVGDIQQQGPLGAAFREAERNARFRLDLDASYSDPCEQCHAVCRAYGQARATT